MGTHNTHLDPATVVPTRGQVLVKIIEILGGMTKGGIFIPGDQQDHSGKDTFYGLILRTGPPPTLAHYKSDDRGPGIDVRPNKSGAEWPQAIMDNFAPGNIIVFPRDVPLVFTWDNKRYGLCHVHEGILVIDPETFDPEAFQVVPWTTPQVAPG